MGGKGKGRRGESKGKSQAPHIFWPGTDGIEY